MTEENRSSTKIAIFNQFAGLIGAAIISAIISVIGSVIIFVLENSSNNTPPPPTKNVSQTAGPNGEPALPILQPPQQPMTASKKNADKNFAVEPTREDASIPVSEIPPPGSKTRKDSTFAMEPKHEDTTMNPDGDIPSSGAM